METLCETCEGLIEKMKEYEFEASPECERQVKLYGERGKHLSGCFAKLCPKVKEEEGQYMYEP